MEENRNVYENETKSVENEKKRYSEKDKIQCEANMGAWMDEAK